MIDFLTVSQLNFYIKSMFDSDENLANIFLIGEISNLKNHYQSGHIYFSLKDENCVIRAVMFSWFASHLKFTPKDGMKVIVRGKVSLYEASGQYQIYVEDMQQDGFGTLMFQFEKLKEKLEKEGLFDVKNKKSLPQFPEKIGIITSKSGAAIKDLQNVLSRRYPIAKVILCPVQVQGEAAPEQIISAIKKFNVLKACDVLIVGRGGGSAEDLMAFNNEGVARAVASSNIPIISAVGHETDFTICDFCADLRAPTPSAAAELAVPNIDELKDKILKFKSELESAICLKTKEYKNNLEDCCSLLKTYSPLNLIEKRKLNTDFLYEKLKSYYSKVVFLNEEKFSNLLAKLNVLSPLNVLSRGYSITVTKSKRKIIKSIEDTAKNNNIIVRLCDGELDCTINKRRKTK